MDVYATIHLAVTLLKPACATMNVVRHQAENGIARARVLRYVGGISTLCFGRQNRGHGEGTAR